MIIDKIKFLNFRNHQFLEMENPAGLMIIVGDNATGKTNIIEGLQLLSMQESFKNSTNLELIKKDQNESNIAIEFNNNQRKMEISLFLSDKNKRFQFNGKQKNSSDLFGLLPSVLFTPDDLFLTKGPPAARRDFIDSLGCRLSKTFNSIKKDYVRVIKQKNLLLKAEYLNLEILNSWNQNLAKLGASLYIHRVGLYQKIMIEAAAVYKRISGGEELSADYVSSFFIEEFTKKNDDTLGQEQIEILLINVLQERQAEEISAKRSLVGPHRDDINFFINGQDVRRYGSQGQQRSVALALKIAEIEILRAVTGSEPLLLLDDVMSELDEQRREQLLVVINNSTQTFITTTNLGYFNKQTLARAKLLHLPTDGQKQ